MPDLTQLAAAARLATAASTPQEGDGSLLVFSMARACLDLPDGPAAAWVDLAEVVAKRGLVASAKHSQILEGTRRDRRAKVWGPMLRMADLHAQQKLAPGCRVAIGLVLSQGLISGTALSKKVADQLSGMAGACVRGSGHEYADEWVAFSQLDLLNVDELQAVVDSGAPEQIRALAATLRRAVEGLAALPKPADIREGLPSGTAAAGSGIEAPNELPEKTTTAPEQAHASEGGEQSSRGPHKQVVTIELAGLSLTDIRLCDVEVKQKPSKPGVVPRKQQPAAMPPLSEAAERAVNADTLAILQERQQGQHSKHDDLEDRIKSCDNADHVRRLLVAVKKSWVTSHAGSEATSWGKLDGIRDYLPTRESATFQGVIREVGTGSRRMAMLELQADVDQTWRDAVERSTARATGYLKLRYATQETGDLLSRLHALKLPVQIEANVRMTLVDGAPADFCVSNARAWGVTEAEIETAVQKMVAELRFGLPAANDAEA